MKNAKTTFAALGTALCLTVLLSDSIRAAEWTSTQQQPTTTRPLTDVSLGAGGLLNGIVRDGNGSPKANAPVTLVQNQREIASTTTDEYGRFAIRGVRGGAYIIVSGSQANNYRAWAPGTAPPSAGSNVQLQVGPVVRGHFGGKIGSHLPSLHPVQYLHNPIAIGGVIGMAVGLPIILHDDEPGGS